MVFGDDRHNAGKIYAWDLVERLVCDEKNVNNSCIAVRVSKIS